MSSGPVIERELVQLPATAAMYRLTMETVQHNSDMLYSKRQAEQNFDWERQREGWAGSTSLDLATSNRVVFDSFSVWNITTSYMGMPIQWK